MNTLSRSVSKLSEQELRNLENDRIENFSDDEQEGLAEAGLIVPRDIDEIALLREGFERSKRGRSHATITVLTTLSCNFECSCCFQNRTSSIISPEVQDLVVEHIGIAASHLLPLCDDGGIRRGPSLPFALQAVSHSWPSRLLVGW